MLYQKMRPYRFDDMVGQTVIVENIRSQSKRNVWFPVYILAGQYGSGKTSMAKIISLAANCDNKDVNGNPCLICDTCRNLFDSMDFKEIDAASNTGVDNIRGLIEWMGYKALGKKKVVIIDEVHMLSPNAFNSLLKMLEDPPHYAIFILCTTDVDSIPLPVQSRSACYSFGRIQESLIANHVMDVAGKNKIVIDEEASSIIAKYSDGSMRNALQLLEQFSASGKTITGDLCREILGISNEDSLFELLDALLCHNVPGFLDMVRKLGQVGKNLSVLTNELLLACADLIAASAGGIKALSGSDRYIDNILAMTDKYPLPVLCQLSEKIMILRQAAREDSSQNWFIVNGISIIQQLKNSDSTIAEEVDQLKKKFSAIQGKVLAIKDVAMIKSGEEADSKGLLPAKADPSDLLPENPDSKVAFPDEQVSKVNNSLEERFHIVGNESEPEDELQEQQVINEQKPMESFYEEEDFFDDYLIGSIIGINQEQYDEKQETSIDVEKNSMELSLAQEAEFQINELCDQNPELKAHIQVGCKKMHLETGLCLVTPEQSVCNMLLLYIGRAGIKNVFVECR